MNPPRRCVLRRLAALALATAVSLVAPPATAAEFFQPLLGDLKAELATTRAQKKAGVVLVYEMESCPFCERLHRTVLSRPEVQSYYARHFAAYRIDIQGADTLTGFDGASQAEAAFTKQQRVAGTPTTIFYDLDGREVARFAGVPRDGAEFVLLGRYVVEGAFRKVSFVEYRRQAR